VEEIPALIQRGVVSFKIEGRLKSPEYVAAVCRVYRKAIDAALGGRDNRLTKEEKYQLEMTFSRGLFTGWMHGVDHQQLVSARFGKKRGPFVGRIRKVGPDYVEVDGDLPVKAGDGVVFDTGGDTNNEQGGRIWQTNGRRLHFERGRVQFNALKPGDRVWKTDDPELNKHLLQSFAGRIQPRHRAPVSLTLSGRAGEPLVFEARIADSAKAVRLTSNIALVAARTAPLTPEKAQEHLGRFGDEPYRLTSLEFRLEGEVLLPIAELNRLRREMIAVLNRNAVAPRVESPRTWRDLLQSEPRQPGSGQAHLAVLVRNSGQLEAVLSEGVRAIYCDFEDIRRYADAVSQVRSAGTGAQVLLATPRIQKAGEQGFFRLIENAQPDGVLIRNLGSIDYFSDRPHLRRVGDFSLNVANPLTAAHFIQKKLERVTVSYDLNAEQVLDLVEVAPPDWFEVTIHQHMPMFHMEHCVFAAFLSKGSSHLDCGRPCEKHRVHLRDRVGIEHPLRADVGCRNTLFNAVPQSGATYLDAFLKAGLRHYRVELLEETATETAQVIGVYRRLLEGARLNDSLWRELGAQSQLGVTKGTLASA
jgi:putative protease